MKIDNQRTEIVQDLKQLGFQIEFISDLYNQKMNYKTAIPVLIKWLPQVDDKISKESIVRALSVKWARPQAASALLGEFYNADNSNELGIRWVIGSALEVVSDESVVGDLIGIVKNKEFGKDRQMVVLALGNMSEDLVFDTLVDLLRDEDVVGHAVAALSRLKSKRALPILEQFSNHSKSWIRNQARAGIAKLRNQ